MENRWVRLVIMIVVFVVSFVISFKCTPDLNKVENRSFYRVALGMFITRGVLMLLLHDSFGIFPLE